MNRSLSFKDQEHLNQVRWCSRNGIERYHHVLSMSDEEVLKQIKGKDHNTASMNAIEKYLTDTFGWGREEILAKRKETKPQMIILSSDSNSGEIKVLRVF